MVSHSFYTEGVRGGEVKHGGGATGGCGWVSWVGLTADMPSLEERETVQWRIINGVMTKHTWTDAGGRDG